MKYWVRAIGTNGINEQLLVSSETEPKLQEELSQLLHVKVLRTSLSTSRIRQLLDSADRSTLITTVEVETEIDRLEKQFCGPSGSSGTQTAASQGRSPGQSAAPAAASGDVSPSMALSSGPSPRHGVSLELSASLGQAELSAGTGELEPSGGASAKSSSMEGGEGPAGAALLKKVVLTRERLNKLIDSNYSDAFYSAVQGSLVRLRTKQGNGYMVATVASVESHNQLLIDFSYYLELRHTDSISNGEPTHDELLEWFRLHVASATNKPSSSGSGGVGLSRPGSGSFEDILIQHTSGDGEGNNRILRPSDIEAKVDQISQAEQKITELESGGRVDQSSASSHYDASRAAAPAEADSSINLEMSAGHVTPVVGRIRRRRSSLASQASGSHTSSTPATELRGHPHTPPPEPALSPVGGGRSGEHAPRHRRTSADSRSSSSPQQESRNANDGAEAALKRKRTGKNLRKSTEIDQENAMCPATLEAEFSRDVSEKDAQSTVTPSTSPPKSQQKLAVRVGDTNTGGSSLGSSPARQLENRLLPTTVTGRFGFNVYGGDIFLGHSMLVSSTGVGSGGLQDANEVGNFLFARRASTQAPDRGLCCGTRIRLPPGLVDAHTSPGDGTTESTSHSAAPITTSSLVQALGPETMDITRRGFVTHGAPVKWGSFYWMVATVSGLQPASRFFLLGSDALCAHFGTQVKPMEIEVPTVPWMWKPDSNDDSSSGNSEGAMIGDPWCQLLVSDDEHTSHRGLYMLWTVPLEAAKDGPSTGVKQQTLGVAVARTKVNHLVHAKWELITTAGPLTTVTEHHRCAKFLDGEECPTLPGNSFQLSFAEHHRNISDSSAAQCPGMEFLTIADPQASGWVMARRASSACQDFAQEVETDYSEDISGSAVSFLPYFAFLSQPEMNAGVDVVNSALQSAALNTGLTNSWKPLGLPQSAVSSPSGTLDGMRRFQMSLCHAGHHLILFTLLAERMRDPQQPSAQLGLSYGLTWLLL